MLYMILCTIEIKEKVTKSAILELELRGLGHVYFQPLSGVGHQTFVPLGGGGSCFL